MRVRYLEQIINGMRARTETEKAARRVLISRVNKLRWCFWHAKESVQKLGRLPRGPFGGGAGFT